MHGGVPGTWFSIDYVLCPLFGLAICWHKGHPWSPKDKKKAGRAWAQEPLKRFPQLMCRKATNLSVWGPWLQMSLTSTITLSNMKRSCITLRSPNQYKFGPVMRQAHRTFQRRKRSSVRNVNLPVSLLLLFWCYLISRLYFRKPEWWQEAVEYLSCLLECSNIQVMMTLTQ